MMERPLIAAAIADRLMTNGNGDVAIRLVLELPDGRDGGGRCRAAVIKTVLDMLGRGTDAGVA